MMGGGEGGGGERGDERDDGCGEGLLSVAGAGLALLVRADADCVGAATLI